MRNIFLLKAFFLFWAGCGLFADDITGFWQTMDSNTNRPSSVVAVYQYEGRYYGRILGTFNEEGELKDTIYSPKKRTQGLAGNPYYCGLDIVWRATPTKTGKYKGFVVDPRDGKVYDAKLWRENGNLILRGEVFVFGKSVVWPPFPEENFTKEFRKPDLASFIPNIPSRN